MLTVYIEAVLFDNMLVNLFLIYLVSFCILNTRVKKWRMVLASAVGAALAFPVLYIEKTFLLFLYKVGVALLLPVIFGGFKSFKGYLLTTVSFVAVTFAFGGVVYGLGLFIGGLNTNTGILGLIALAGLFTAYFIRQLKIKHTESARHETVKIIIHTGCGAREFTGFWDTGNTLFDFCTLKPVIVISQKVLEAAEAERRGEISVKTVTGEKVLPLVSISGLKIAEKEREIELSNVLATVSEIKKDYDVILNCALMPNAA